MFPAGVSLPVSQKYTSHGASLLYHVMFQEVHTRTRKEVESKHHGTVKELTSEHHRLKATFIVV